MAEKNMEDLAAELQLKSEAQDFDGTLKIIEDNKDVLTTCLQSAGVREILKKAGFVSEKGEVKVAPVDSELKEIDLKKFAVEELEKMLSKCVEREEYERAAEIKRIIIEKKGE